jgi:hypothetical protein
MAMKPKKTKAPAKKNAWWWDGTEDSTDAQRRQSRQVRRKECLMASKGLYANINAKKNRIKAGSKEKMRKPGTRGAPTAEALSGRQKPQPKRGRYGTMATSGSKDFELDVAEYVEEAFERCGLEVRTGYDLKSAKRSLNLLLADWANRGLNQWTIKQRTLAMVSGQGDYSVGADVIDILSVVVQRDGTDYSLLRLSRDGFLTIPNKTTQGRVNQFFLDRQISPNLKLWPVPDNDTDVVYYDALTRMDDADIYTNTMDLPFRFYPCLAAGLAYYLALKRAPNRVEMLKAIYEEEFERAAVEDRDRASFNVAPQFDYYRIG